MPNSTFKEGQHNASLAYAHEANPKKMSFEDWWENSRRIMGGDDCAIALPIEWFEDAIASGKKTFRLQFLARSIKLVV